MEDSGSEGLPPLEDVEDEILRLELRELQAADPVKGWVPAYRFTMVDVESGAPIGLIDLRVGDTPGLRLYAGHIGYAVAEDHRGRGHAGRAVRLLAPFATRLGLDPLVITCDPANDASRRTIEGLGARYLETVDVPPTEDMYHSHGARRRMRFELCGEARTAPDRRPGRG